MPTEIPAEMAAEVAAEMAAEMAAENVLVVLQDGVQLLDVAGPLDVLDAANRLLGRQAYAVRTASLHGRDVRTGNGVVIRVDGALVGGSPAAPTGTLLVPGGLETSTNRPGRDDEGVQAVRRLAADSRRTASVCSGALTLAAAGLLDGRRATTHWAFAGHAARAFPSVHWEPDRILVADGPVLTSAGVTAGIDLGLALVEADHGLALAREVARWLVVFLRRPGGQSQFRTGLALPPLPDGPLQRVVDHVVARPGGDHRLESLAEHVALSPRHLSRLFRADLHTTPARFVEAVRVEVARDSIERGATVEAAARRSGFASAEVMRRTFLRVLGVAPSQYRARFATAATAVAS